MESSAACGWQQAQHYRKRPVTSTRRRARWCRAKGQLPSVTYPVALRVLCCLVPAGEIDSPAKESEVRRQTLFFLLFTLFVAIASAQQDDSAAVNCTQFMAWTAGGMSSQRLDRLARQRGIALPSMRPYPNPCRTPGREPSLLQSLRPLTRGSGKAEAGSCPPHLPTQAS